jgi:hypothetical protein
MAPQWFAVESMTDACNSAREVVPAALTPNNRQLQESGSQSPDQDFVYPKNQLRRLSCGIINLTKRHFDHFDVPFCLSLLRSAS